MKIFISQIMKDRSDEEIQKRRRAIETLCRFYFKDKAIEFIDSWISEDPPKEIKTIPAWYAGKSIQMLAEADVAVFESVSPADHGCYLEYQTCYHYNIPVLGVPILMEEWRKWKKNQEKKDSEDDSENGASIPSLEQYKTIEKTRFNKRQFDELNEER